jgi:hypothetical protein
MVGSTASAPAVHALPLTASQGGWRLLGARDARAASHGRCAMVQLATLAPQVIPAASAGVALASFLAYLHFSHRNESHAARDEAMALAATRAEVIADLRRRVAELEAQLAAVGAQRADAQRRAGAAVSHLLVDLSADPPDVDSAVDRILRLLDDGH